MSIWNILSHSSSITASWCHIFHSITKPILSAFLISTITFFVFQSAPISILLQIKQWIYFIFLSFKNSIKDSCSGIKIFSRPSGLHLIFINLFGYWITALYSFQSIVTVTSFQVTVTSFQVIVSSFPIPVINSNQSLEKWGIS